MNKKQQQLLFDKGITNVPSDALCSDNALEESIGMVYDNGEHRVIQKPKEFMADVTGNLVYVHQDRYILDVNDGDDHSLVWQTEDGQDSGNVCSLEEEEVKGVTSVGKTLIVTTPSGLKYALWNGEKYKEMGSSIPEIDVHFSLSDTTQKAVSDYNDRYVDVEGMVEAEKVDFNVSDVSNNKIGWHKYSINKENDARSAIIGLVSKRLNEVKKDKRFAFPFWVRFAIRLYDGSYTQISNPVLMLPTEHHNCDAFFCSYGDGPEAGEIYNNFSHTNGTHGINYLPASAELLFTVTMPNIQGWEDIIDGVDVFVSKEARSFDIDDKWEIINPSITNSWDDQQEHDKTLYDGCYGSNPFFREMAMWKTPPQGHEISWYFDREYFDEEFGCYLSPSHYSESEIIDTLIGNSTFYKLFELNIEDVETGVQKRAFDYIRKGTLENLVTQEQLPYDDYFSHSDLSAEVIKTYNSRLHLGNVKRSFFEGFSQFSYSAYTIGSLATLDVYVYINSNDGDRIIKKTISTSEVIDTWFYYPDTRAYKAEFYNGQNIIMTLTLREHPYLHGAYYLRELPSATDIDRPVGVLADAPAVKDEMEELPNTLAVSEADNPFVFTAKGYHENIGMGTITGLAIQTTALGQEEHGKHPLLVFMTKGIWIMMVDDEGQYIRSDAFSREVSVNQKAITETDGAVFFASEKGLMLIVGSAVKCVSEQLSGKTSEPFTDYLKSAFIAYDYRDSLLWIFDGASHTENDATTVGSTKCWVYSIKSGTFGRYDFKAAANIITTAVNNYPDYLLQDSENVYSLIERANINLDDFDQYKAIIKTRPMKLENALALKSIMQVMHIHNIDDLNAEGQNNPTLAFKIFASNNLKTWVQLQSLRGTPWKYYRFEYDFEKLKATDRFSGTMVVTQERRTDKLR